MRARRNRRAGLTSSLIRIGVLALIAGGGWWFWKQRRRPAAEAPTFPTIPAAPAVPTEPSEPEPQPSDGDESKHVDEPATIKGNASSMLYHTPASPSYKRLKAEVWFQTEEEARAAGYRRWDHKRTSGGAGG
jgi:hypothetical protein